MWRRKEKIKDAIEESVKSEMFEKIYGDVYAGDDVWRALPVPEGDLYSWDPASTYVKKPPYFEGMTAEIPPIPKLEAPRAIPGLGNSITTAHSPPPGVILRDSPAGRYLLAGRGVPGHYNPYGSRRGCHEVMVWGSF